ncbi:MAG: acetylglutamate kinase [Rhodospirillales bacterium]|jgi:acetylglutamate kinase
MTEPLKTQTAGVSPEAIAKSRVLAEALPFMRRYAGRTVVVKYGGHAMGDEAVASAFARDVVLLKQVGINPIVVHGGGPQIAQMLDRLSIKSSFVDGLRVTDARTVEVVEMVLAGSVNKQLAAAINSAGGTAIGLSGRDGRLIRARRVVRTRRDPATGREETVDLGFVGEPDEVNADLLRTLAAADIIPVIAPVGFGADGETYNINADTAAGAVAGAVGATRLLMMTDVMGVLDRDRRLLQQLTPERVHEMIAEGTISGGMIPKVETCLYAVARGVEGAVILDGRLSHAILLELFTDGGVGTLIGKSGSGSA